MWACDLFGQGASWPASPPDKTEKLVYSIDTWTEQLAAFIREIISDEGGVYVAGNSLGGLLAVTLAYRHPEVPLDIPPPCYPVAMIIGPTAATPRSQQRIYCLSLEHVEVLVQGGRGSSVAVRGNSS